MLKTKSIGCLAVFSFFIANALVSAGAEEKAQTPPATQNNDVKQLVKDVLQHELEAQSKDQSLWCFHKQEEKNGKPQQSFAACQSKAGEIDRLLAVNGHALDETQQRDEDSRIQNLLKNPAQLKKRAQQEHQDGQQAERLLKMIPEAFLFTKESSENGRLKLRFTPNPKFRPSGNEAQVFHHMEGTLVLDTKQRRLAEINGRLMDTVKFGGGLLGHLDKGGTFVVKQEEVAPQVWEVTTMDVRMDGKALFFKTIAVREKEMNSEFKLVPPGTSIQQAAAMTKEKNVEITAKK